MQESQVQIVPSCATQIKRQPILEKKRQALQIAAYGATWINLLQINAKCATMAQKKCWDMNIPIFVVVQSFLVVQQTKKYFKKTQELGELKRARRAKARRAKV
jgi:pyruvate/2-oxoacid:ferredoxin oxidoreductase beta subunit